MRSGDDQQVLGQPDQVIGLLGRPPDRFPELLGGARPGPSELQLATEDRQRCSELVARVIDEPAFVLHGARDAIEHRVERLAQPSDLVLGSRHGQPTLDVRRGDRGRISTHPLHGLERATGQEPSSPAHQTQCDGATQSEGRRELKHLVAPVLEGGAHQDVVGSRGEIDRNDHQPGRVVDPGYPGVEEGGSCDRAELRRRLERLPPDDVARLDDASRRVRDLRERLVPFDEVRTNIRQGGPVVAHIPHQDLRAVADPRVDRVQQIG